MDDEIKKILQENEELNKLSEHVLIVSRDKFRKYLYDKPINLDNGCISRLLLDDLLKINYYYDYVMKLASNEISILPIKFIQNDGLSAETILVTKKILASAIGYLEKEKKENSIDETKKDMITSSMDYKTFYEENKNNYYEINVDNSRYRVRIGTILDFYLLDNNSFYKCINSDEIYGIPKEHFLYIAKSYIEKNTVIMSYDVPMVFENRYNMIGSNQIVDIEAVNTYLDIDFNGLERVVINPKLRSKIMDDLDTDMPLLEKAMYIYIKLCMLFTYDDEFFVFNQEGDSAKKHEQIEHLTKIGDELYNVVCYEFNAIYAYFLKEIGINFSVIGGLSSIGKYGGTHQNLIFRCDKYLVKADAVKSVLNGDLINAKFNRKLNGMTCINTNRNTQYQFDELLDNVYERVNENLSFEEALDMYKRTEDKDIDINFNKKIDMYKKIISTKQFKGMDAFSYLLNVRKVIFDRELSKIVINIIRNNNPNNGNKNAMATAVITTNQYGIESKKEDNKYMIYDPLEGFKDLSIEELIERFDSGSYEYIGNFDGKVPGIEVSNGGKTI